MLSESSSPESSSPDSSSSDSSSPPPPNRYMTGEYAALAAPDGFPPHRINVHGPNPAWYNKFIRAWVHWGREIIPHEKSLWIETVDLLRPATRNTRKIHSHGLGKGISDDNIDQTVSWAKVVAVMLNADFFPDVIKSVWMSRAQTKFPHATVLKDGTGYWEQLPVISEAEAQPWAIPAVASPAATFETPPTGTPATSSTPGHHAPPTPSHLGDQGTPTPAPRQHRAAANAPFTSLEEANKEYKKLQERFCLRCFKESVKSSRKAYLDG